MDFSKSGFPRLFLQAVGKPVREGVLLRDYSNLRIGGRADYFFEAATVEELKSSFLVARKTHIPLFVMGGGFNLLFDDAGFRGLILKNSVRKVGPSKAGDCPRAAAGTPIRELVNFASENSLTGLEFLAGIPGTVGGAVFGNAGAFGQSVGDFLEEAILRKENGKEFQVSRDYFAFGYRHSQLKIKHRILLEATFRLRPGTRENIRANIERNLAMRARKHPPQETATAGSYFKNPILPDGTKATAGFLLEHVGAREVRVGDAAVYPGHCNFLVNSGNAKARDILALAAELKKRVKEKFGIELEEEVIFLPADSSKS
jgi:UDP-N-acetylmuramate dehydrogenase